MATILDGESGLDVRNTLNAALGAEVVLGASAPAGFSSGRVLTDTASVTWDFTNPDEAKANVAGVPAGGIAPANAQYIVAATDATLTAERVATNTATVTWDFATSGQAKATAVGSAITGIPAGGITFTTGHVVLGRNTNSAGAGEEVTVAQFLNWGTVNLTVGFTSTANNAGTKSSGTFTPDPATGQYQRAVNGGAHTLAPPSASPGDSVDMVIQYTNNASAGTITTSGFTKVTGDALTTVNGDDFLFFITVCNGFSLLNVQAMQ